MSVTHYHIPVPIQAPRKYEPAYHRLNKTVIIETNGHEYTTSQPAVLEYKNGTIQTANTLHNAVSETSLSIITPSLEEEPDTDTFYYQAKCYSFENGYGMTFRADGSSLRVFEEESTLGYADFARILTVIENEVGVELVPASDVGPT